MPTLKVFRTPIGFHDAYVAAPSRKAALAAWGADADLFSRGVAEQVTDDTLTAEPLKRPGVVIKVSRGSQDDHFRVLREESNPRSTISARKTPASGSTKAARPRSKSATPSQSASPRPKARKLKPSRVALDAAEAALAEADAAFQQAIKDLSEQEAQLRRERQALRKRHDLELHALEARRNKAHLSYQTRIKRWASQ